MGKLTFAGLLIRFVASALLVGATYNPSGHSYAHWVSTNFPHVEPLQAVAGIALLGAWLFFLSATWRSLGILGVGFSLAFFAAVTWLFSSWGWVNLSDHSLVAWIALLMVACLLTLGLCWALIQERVSGQVLVDETRR